MPVRYLNEIKLELSTKRPDIVLDENQEHLITYLMSLLMGKRIQKDNIFRAHKIPSSYFKPQVKLPEGFLEYRDKINKSLLTEGKLKEIREALLASGYVTTSLCFECENSDYFEEVTDIEDAAFFERELAKSKTAKETFGEFSPEYEQNRGKIFHLRSGSEGHDPIRYLYHRDTWAKSLNIDVRFVTFSDNDILKAMKELLPIEWTETINNRALEIASERLSEK